MLGNCETPFELGVEPESRELEDKAETDTVFLPLSEMVDKIQLYTMDKNYELIHSKISKVKLRFPKTYTFLQLDIQTITSLKFGHANINLIELCYCIV